MIEKVHTNRLGPGGNGRLFDGGSYCGAGTGSGFNNFDGWAVAGGSGTTWGSGAGGPMGDGNGYGDSVGAAAESGEGYG